AAPGGDELRAVIEGEIAVAARPEAAAEATRTLEYRDLGIGAEQFLRTREACHARTDDGDPDVHERFLRPLPWAEVLAPRRNPFGRAGSASTRPWVKRMARSVRCA
ncbi:MAG: hypothetical protein K0R70_956, partial [Steroidobacteraceae bacterium]|nr:hypothetical protein [Steroidobacteraceae bacterium]